MISHFKQYTLCMEKKAEQKTGINLFALSNKFNCVCHFVNAMFHLDSIVKLFMFVVYFLY